MSDEYDILIKNAHIVDGTGASGYKGAIAVKGERIAAVGDVSGDAVKVIDAGGHVVSPGFIDVHNHGDMTIIYYPTAEGFLRQGITTFVGGNCGSSPGPFGDLLGIGMMNSDIVADIAPDNWGSGKMLTREELNPHHKEVHGFDIYWYTMGEFFKKLEDMGGISANYVPLLGHHQLRHIAMGNGHKRNATQSEVEQMKKTAEQAMLDGCKGMSVGRDYGSNYAEQNEIIEIAKVVSKHGGLFTSHCLRTGLRVATPLGVPPVNKVGGLLEAINVGRQAKMPVQISHLGSLYDVFPRDNLELNIAAAKATLKIVDDAVAEGIDVTFDVIPNIRGFGTGSSNWLVSSLLPWLKIAGSREQFAEALRMPGLRKEITDFIMSGNYRGINPHKSPNWAAGKRIMESNEPSFVNKSVAQIAKDMKREPLDALMEILMIDPYAKTGSMGRNNPTKYLFYQHPGCMMGIDTLAADINKVSRHPPWGVPSENSFGGWAAFFRMVVREEKILSLEEAVRKGTSLSAAKFKLEDRGVLKPGAYADITVFDIDTITDKATPTNPCLYPEGIEYVIVNGNVVVSDSEHNGSKPGKILLNK